MNFGKKKINLKKEEVQETLVQSKINLAKQEIETDPEIKKGPENQINQQEIAQPSSIQDQTTNGGPRNKIFCTSCGGGNDEQSLFCQHCGHRLAEEAVVPNIDRDYSSSNTPDLSRIEKSAYELKVNSAYPVYIPHTLEEKRAVVALSFIDNLIRVFKEKWNTSTGRASRREYWLVMLAVLGVELIVYSIFGDSGTSRRRSSGGLSPSLIILSLGFMLAMFRLTVRRLHDIGKSGWWLTVSFIPYLGSLYLLYLMAQQGDAHINEYGKPENYYEATKEERKALGIDK